MVNQQRVELPSGGLTLEGVLYSPADAKPASLAVVCHPHPQYGGDMHNFVVAAIVRGLMEAGFGALAFNFRGVGASEGSFDNGSGERDDVRSVLSYARSLPGVQRVALAGYSFGAGMAAAAVDTSVTALGLIALPPGMVRPDNALKAYAGPVLMASGSNDHISPEHAIRALADSLPVAPQVIVVPGADHFWWGHERPLAQAIRDFFGAHHP